MLEKHRSPKRTGRNYDNAHTKIEAQILDLRERSLSCGLATSSSLLDTRGPRNKDGSPRKRVQFFNEQSRVKNGVWIHPDTGFPESSQLEKGLSRSEQKRCASFRSRNVMGIEHLQDAGALSSGCLDWLWSEDLDRQGVSLVTDAVHEHLVSCSSIEDSPAVQDSVDHLLGKSGELLSANDMINTRHRKWIDAGKVVGARAAVASTDSPRCSSMSMTDLVETISIQNAPRPCQACPTLANDFSMENDIGAYVSPLSPLHCSSPSSISVSKRGFPGVKSETKIISINDPVPVGTPIHGVLHCTLRDGLPNYTFLVDEYEEVVTAKIWMEDMVLGEEHGSWRYTFYSLKGEGKKKGKSGWKHWKKKEKLASILVGKMKVSSNLCSTVAPDGERDWSVESEFILLSAKSPEPVFNDQEERVEEPPFVAHADLSSQTCSSSSDVPAHACGRSSHVLSSTSSSTPQSVTSSSDGCSNVSSPGRISSWYVSQSLLPSSLAAPEMMAHKGRGKARKWSIQSGISGIRLSKTRFKTQEVCQLEPPELSNETLKGNLSSICWQNQCQSELAAMIINVPLDAQDRQHPSDTASHSEKIRVLEGPHTQAGSTADCCEASMSHIPNSGASHKQQRHANITVVLPSGNHGRPFIDSKGPSPLIKRWKDGGKCDCKGWDLGCGLMVLNNLQREEKSCEQYGESQGQHGKPLMLYKQDMEHEEALLSLAPQENGLIALDFRAPLSPLQAFAIAVAILHGRESGMPNEDSSQVVPIACDMVGYHHMENYVDLSSVIVPSMREVEEKMANGLVQLPVYSNQDMSQFHDSLVTTPVKVQGSEVLNCTAGLSLSFERV